MLGAIGNTPLVQLTRLPEPGSAEIWVKLESYNPTGSYKDRMALAMIEGAERSGKLQPGQTVVEYTGGSTGSSLAFVCSVKGYPLRIVTSDAFAVEKTRTIEAFGAEVEVISSPEGITPELIPRMMARAAQIVDEVDGFATDQFRNTDMIDGYRGMGRELLAQLNAPPDAFCSYIGTSSPRSRPSCQAGSAGRITSKAAARASGPRCSGRTISTRSSRSRTPRRLRRRGVPPRRKGSSRAPRRARTSPRLWRSPNGLVPAGAS
jgi:Pyridoxal-phosphate dependent enzyme